MTMMRTATLAQATTMFVAVILALIACGICAGQDEERHPGWEPLPGDLDPEQNIALGREVSFAPAADYGLTSRDDTDATDLTDGVLSDHHRGHLWFDRKCIGYSYGGRVNLALDLGEVAPIDEIAIRIQGGSPQAGVCTPTWLEALVSDDGQTWRRAGEFSTYRRGDLERFGVPHHAGEAWVHRFRFRDLNTRARFVGLRMYTAGLTVGDEMYVFRGDHHPDEVDVAALPVTDFAVDRPQMYLHKPYLCFLTNIAAPNAVGMVMPEGFGEEDVTVTLELPPGVELVGGGGFGRPEDAPPLDEVEGEQIADGWTRYAWSGSASSTTKTWGRLFITGDWEDGREGLMRYRLSHADGAEGPLVAVPLRAIEVPETPRPERLLTGLSWYNMRTVMRWPGGLDDFGALGMNTITAFVHWLRDEEEHRDAWDFWEQARERGFNLLSIDSTFHRMADEPETRCQLEGGEVSDRRCPSYRGEYYQREIERVARQTAMARPHYLLADVEIWNWAGPTDAEKCTRCRQDFAESGLETWDEWKLAQGYEMWTDVVAAVREAVAEAGGPEVEFGVYDWRTGHNYQYTWPFDRLYPEYLQSAQPSTYTPLYWGNIMLVGDEARHAREGLPRPDVLPWISPGDAGTFDGERFRYALLECFCNGSRGMNFWSGRVWDPENLAAYARVIRNLAPVEDLLLAADLLEGAQVQGAGRVSGVVADGEMVVLVADYWREADGAVSVTLPVEDEMTATDLDGGETLPVAGDGTLTVPLGDERARVFHVTR